MYHAAAYAWTRQLGEGGFMNGPDKGGVVKYYY